MFYIEVDLSEIELLLKQLDESNKYDVQKLIISLTHHIRQLVYYFCILCKDRDEETTFYHIQHKPHVHQLAYFNIGRGFPKELMDGHWCYVVKDLGSKVLVVPCTSIKKDSTKANPSFEKDIVIEHNHTIMYSRIQLSDIRSIDLQRLDVRKPFYRVITPKKEIYQFIHKNLFE